MPGGTKMYRQRVKNSNFSNFDDIFSFGRQMGSCEKNYKNPPSSLFLGINWLMLQLWDFQWMPIKVKKHWMSSISSMGTATGYFERITACFLEATCCSLKLLITIFLLCVSMSIKKLEWELNLGFSFTKLHTCPWSQIYISASTSFGCFFM